MEQASPTIETESPRPSRAVDRLKTLVVLLAISLGFVSVPVAYVVFQEGKIEQRTARLRAAGIPVSVADIEASLEPYVAGGTSIGELEDALEAIEREGPLFVASDLLAGPPFPWDDDQPDGPDWNPVLPEEALEIAERLRGLGAALNDAFGGDFDPSNVDGALHGVLHGASPFPERGSVEHDLIRLASLDFEPLRERIADALPLARYDLRREHRLNEEGFGLAQSTASFGSVGLRLAVTSAVLVAGIEGDGEATVEGLLRLLEIAELRLDDRAPIGLILRGQLYEDCLRALVIVSAALDDAQLERIRERLLAIDLEWQLRRAVEAEVAYGTQNFRLVRGVRRPEDLLGEYSPDHIAHLQMDEPGPFERVRHAGLHAQFLLYVEEALRRVDAHGLRANEEDSLAELEMPETDAARSPGDIDCFVDLAQIATAVVQVEAMRRQALIAIEVALEGDGPLTDALDRWPDPLTGHPFDVGPGEGGERVLTSQGVGGSFDYQLVCPLRLPRPGE